MRQVTVNVYGVKLFTTSMEHNITGKNISFQKHTPYNAPVEAYTSSNSKLLT